MKKQKLGVENDTRTSVENDTSSAMSPQKLVSITTPDKETINAL
jgi:hypothetical protein